VADVADQGIKVIKANSATRWSEVPRPEGDETPPGEDHVAFASADGRFATGLWRRPAREGAMTRPYDEVSIIIEGTVEVVDPDGTVHRADPGDVLITPRGSSGTWRNVTPVKKFWATCEAERNDPRSSVIPSGHPHAWSEVPRPAGDENPPGEETVVFRSADGRFVCGLWRRVPERGDMVPPYDEIAYVLQGEVEVTEPDGRLHLVEQGDVLVTPLGSKAVWNSLSPVLKFWAIYKPERP
jgi:uncharacterized cupin superfamily protein